MKSSFYRRNKCLDMRLTKMQMPCKSIGNAIRDISKKHSKLVSAELSTWDLSSKEIHQVYKLASKFLKVRILTLQKPGMMEDGRTQEIWNLRRQWYMNKEILLSNIDKVHTTEMGIDRIKKNLRLDTDDVVEWCRKKVLDEGCNIYKRGKNWYCEIDNIKITINSYSYTIITAHMIKYI